MQSEYPASLINKGDTKSKSDEYKGISFTNDQREAINGLLNFINSDFTEEKFIYGLVGPGGVGKTFCIKYIIDKCKYSNSLIRCTAPTHKACRVFSQAIGNKDVFTIQSTFGFRLNLNLADFDYKNPQFDPGASPKLDNVLLLIIDESSMLGAGLVQYIINTCRKRQIKLIFIGDSSQLPPVNEHTSSAFANCVKTYHLNEIVRQKDDNPVVEFLDILRTDINNKTFKSIEYISKHKGDMIYNDNGEGFSIVGQRDFTNIIATKFQDEEYTKNIDKYKVIAYTNIAVTRWNNFIRHEIINQSDKAIITKHDLIMSYKTTVDEFNSVIINNSEEYIINDIVNYVDTTYQFKGFLVKFQMVNSGFITKPMFIVDHTDKFSILKYIQVLDDLIKDAKSASAATRSKRWKEYFEFKDKYLLLTNINRNGQIIYPRDLDYGFAITSHRAQGSTYENVFVDVNDIVFDKNGKIYPDADDMLRRLYVACSRTKKDLVISYGL